ncbi:MAG: ThiF family adenylyltransferase [Archangiaceae bacterium]|nr:ThiF family adenylyltransferase [Archangiaceae bacterium]
MRVLIVGVGGLGCPAALALHGAHALTLVDHDVVERSNLHRQVLYGPEDLGRPKAEVAARKLPGATALQEKVTAENAPELFRAHDVVLDGTDGATTKLMLSDAAVQTGVPLVYGGVLKEQGQAMVIRPGGPCLRCLFEGATEGPTCAQAGVLGTVAGVVGFKQAELCVSLAAGLHTFDGKSLKWRAVEVRRAADCPSCPASVDITREVCPMTYVRVKLALEKLEKGRLLEVWLKGEEPLKNVPQSAREEGHQVLDLTPHGDRSRLLLKVG